MLGLMWPCSELVVLNFLCCVSDQFVNYVLGRMLGLCIGFIEHVLLNLAVLNMFSVIELCSTLQLVKLSDGWYILFTIYLVILFIYATKCSPICQSCMLRFTNWESRTTEDKSCHWCGNKMRTWHLHICETNDTVGEKSFIVVLRIQAGTKSNWCRGKSILPLHYTVQLTTVSYMT